MARAEVTWHTRYNKSPKGKARQAAYRKRRREKNMASGICIDCCKRPVVLGYVKCEECRSRDNERRWLS